VSLSVQDPFYPLSKILCHSPYIFANFFHKKQVALTMSVSTYKQPLKNDEGIIMVNNGKDWKCKWCETIFKSYNATRALAHLSGIRMHGNTGVSFCQGKIPIEKEKYYKSRARYSNSTQTKKKQKKKILFK
jgi:hypothetical protein